MDFAVACILLDQTEIEYISEQATNDKKRKIKKKSWRKNFVFEMDLLKQKHNANKYAGYTEAEIEKFFEVIKAPDTTTLYGQIEYNGYTTLTGKQARLGQFISKIFGPTSEANSDSDAVQDSFYQQRGFKTNRRGETGDVRELRRRGILDDPVTGQKEVSPRGDSNGAGSSFYDE